MKKRFFLWRWLDSLFSKVKTLAKRFIVPSVAIVEGIDRAVNSNLAPVITALIPGTWDDQIVQKAKKHLPTVLQVLRISENCLQKTDPDEILKCAIEALKTYTKEGRGAAYHNIAALLSVYLSDGKLTWRESLHLAEEIYQIRKSGKDL